MRVGDLQVVSLSAEPELFKGTERAAVSLTENLQVILRQ